MSERLDLFVFVDALGWELASEHRVLEDLCQHRMPLQSVLGYSCACIPTILTGEMPDRHGHFAFFKRARGASPLAGLAALAVLPEALGRSSRVRAWIARFAARRLGFTGYFSLYDVPFGLMPRLDYSEKRDVYRPGGIASGARTVFDELDEGGIPHHVSDWRAGEEANLRALVGELAHRRIRAAYLYLADLDALLHRDGPHGSAVGRKLAAYDRTLRRVMDVAGRSYGDVRLHVFSDHGMAGVVRLDDVQARLEAAGLRQAVDYLGVFDSTMARVWALDERMRGRLGAALAGGPGRVLDDDELGRLGCRFPADEYGEVIYLTDPGVMIFPNHMGRRPAAGMHGYDPAHPVSLASYLSTHAPEVRPRGLWNLKALMLEACGCKEVSHGRATVDRDACAERHIEDR